MVMGMHQEPLVRDMVPTPPPKCKFSTAPHLAKLLHLAPIKKDQAAQTTDPFQARVDPSGDIRLVQRRDGGYVRSRD